MNGDRMMNEYASDPEEPRVRAASSTSLIERNQSNQTNSSKPFRLGDPRGGSPAGPGRDRSVMRMAGPLRRNPPLHFQEGS